MAVFGKNMATSQLLWYKACMHHFIGQTQGHMRSVCLPTCVLAVVQQNFQDITGDSSVASTYVSFVDVNDPRRREYQ